MDPVRNGFVSPSIGLDPIAPSPTPPCASFLQPSLHRAWDPNQKQADGRSHPSGLPK